MNVLKISRIVLYIALVFFLQSCIYETDKLSKVNLNQPDQWHQMDVTLSVNEDSIVIYNATDFHYNISTYELKFNAAVVKFQNSETTYQSSEQLFTINPDITINTWSDLTIDFYLATGSGSIADRLGAENYVGSRTWKVKFLNLETYNFQFNQRVNSKGVLELYFIKPHKFNALNYQVGKVYSGIYLNISKLHNDTVFYADSTYCGDIQEYNLNFKYGPQDYRNVRCSVNYPLPVLKVTTIDFDNCLVSWTSSPIKRKYSLRINDKSMYVGYDTIFKDVQAKIGETKMYDLYSLPVNTAGISEWSYHSQFEHCLGEKAGFGVCYSLSSDQFFISRRQNYPVIEKMVTLPIVDRWDYYWNDIFEMKSSSSGNILIAKENNKLHVYDENLNESKALIIPESAEQLMVADNHTLGYYNNKKYTIKNIGTDASWQEFTFAPHYDDSTYNYKLYYIRGINLTRDGNYVCCRAAYDFYLYDVSDHQNAKLVYTAPRSIVYRVMGNPMNKNELIVVAKGKLEIRSCPEFQLIKEFDTSGLNTFAVCDVDTYSNLLLASSIGFYHIIDLNTMKEVLRLKPYTPDEYSAKLSRKQLFVNNTVTDLSNFLK